MLLSEKNYRRCHCYRRLIIASVIVTGENYLAGVMESMINLRQGLITVVNDSGNNLLQGHRRKFIANVVDTIKQLFAGVNEYIL